MRHDRLEAYPTELLLAVMVFPLILFAFPGMTVYDGERLFLVSFPLWAVCMGRGAAHLIERAKLPRSGDPQPCVPHGSRLGPAASAGRLTLAVVVLLLLGESYSLITLHPCQLSYYNWLVGGLRGADALGFETTYWGDSITRSMHIEIVKRLPVGSTVHVAPVLHPLQLPGMALQSPLLAKHQIQLAAYDDSIRNQVRYVLVFRRQADPRESLNEPTDPSQNAPRGMRQLAELRRAGVQLAVLYENIDHSL